MRRQAYAAISLTLFLILPASPSQTLAQTKPEAPLTGASWQQCLIHYAQTLAIDPAPVSYTHLTLPTISPV